MFTAVLLAATAATIAAWAALLALLRCRAAMREAQRGVIIAQRALDETATLNAPVLLFSCEAIKEKKFVDVWITAFNSGYQATDILNGRITLRSAQMPSQK